MYSPFDPSTRQRFIEQELTRDYLSFPDEVDEAYSAVINWLSELKGMAGFDKSWNVNLDSPKLLHTGRQFSRFLPSHTLKVYQTLLHFESESIAKQPTSLLEQPHILLIDNGCGGGTASVALISLVANYQKYRVAKELPIHPITISCFGVDPNDNALKVYARFLGECASRVGPLLISVGDIRIFPGTLPENAAPIIEWLVEQDRMHCVVFALANIIRPLTKQQARTSERRGVFEMLGIDNLLPNRWGKDIGAEEVTTLNAVLSTGNIDQVVVLLVGAYGPGQAVSDNSRRHWQREMRAFQNAVHARLTKPHRVTIDSVRQRSFAMVNPPDSFYRKMQGYEKSNEIEYDSGFVVIRTKDYMEDTDWQAVLKPKNLLLAWARVRNALAFEMLEDTIELRLFEANIAERLDKLRSGVLAYQWEVLSVPEMLNFQVPKGPDKSPRPMSICRLEDQILATAMLQTKAKEYTAHHLRSYAYRLASGQKGELLYEDWYKQYRKFLADSRRAAEQNPSYEVILTDLSSFYTDIVQLDLFRRVEREMGLYNSRCSDLAENVIKRDCGIGKMGCGIPQGHIVSGAVSNLYLSEIDRLFGPGNCWGIEYFRFVDDMVFIFPPSVGAEFLLGLLDQKLADLGLSRSLDKTSGPMSVSKFLDLTAPDDILEELSKKHNFLLSDLYKLGRDYIRVALDDWWSFVECYQKLLASVGVYISVPRLSRKLQKNIRWWRRIIVWWPRLQMPKAERLEDLKDVDRWLSEFNRHNSDSPDGWICRREDLVRRLSTLFRDSLLLLNSDLETERARARTRVRFALHRLGQLGFGQEANAVVDLIVEQPWTLRPRRVCHDLALQGREDLLIDAFDRTSDREGEEWGYVRGSILKAFPNLVSINDRTISLLQEAAFSGQTLLERTMASEALFLLQETGTLQKTELASAIKYAEDDYLAKNYALLYALTPGDSEILDANLSQGRMLNEALEYIRCAPSLSELFYYEPETLRREFYEGDYPDDHQEFEAFPHS